jgi:flagellar biosynthesis/type III secretory pathway protein FliH
MNSLARRGRLIRSGPETAQTEDVFILGESTGRSLSPAVSVVTASAIVAEAQSQAGGILAEAEAHASAMLVAAQTNAAAVTRAAHDEGFAAGRAEAEAEIAELIELVRKAANEGKQIRDRLAEQSASVIARAAALATRRIVARFYEADPGATADACADALRAAAGQEVLAIRVNTGIVPLVQAALGDAGSYVRPDDAVEIGGCVIDVRHGTIDATLSSRLTLLELAFNHAGGDVA